MTFVRGWYLSLFVLVGGLALVGCPSEKKEKPEQNILHGEGTDEFGFDLSGVQVVLPVVGVQVEADRSLVVTGQSVTLRARQTFGPADAVIEWQAPPEAVVESQDGTGLQVSFSEPGDHLVAAEIRAGDATALAGALIVAVEERGPAVGSLSGDHRVTSEDAARLAGALDGRMALSPEEQARADVNLDGFLDEGDLALVRQAASGRFPAPVLLSPARSSALGRVLVVHPLLMNVADSFWVSLDLEDESALDDSCLDGFGNRDEVLRVRFRRTRPGYLVLQVPLGFSCLSRDVQATVVLHSEDGRTEMLPEPLTLSRLPDVQQENQILTAMGLLRRVFELYPEAMAAYVEAAELPSEDGQLLVAMAQTASELYDEQYGQFHVAFTSLDEQTRRTWDRLAAGLGVTPELLEQLRQLHDELEAISAAYRNKALTPAQSERLIGLICAFGQVADIADLVNKINGWISTGLDVLGWLSWLFPPAKAAVTFLSNVSNIVDMITNLIGEVAKFVPKLGDEIHVAATPGELSLGASALVTASIDIKIASGLCNQAGGGVAGGLTDMLTETLQRQLAAHLPLVGAAFKRAKFQTERMPWLLAKLYDILGSLAGKLVDLTGIGEYLENLVAAFCDKLSDPTLPLDSSFLEPSCGALSDSKWTCTQECAGSPEPAEVSLAGSKAICSKTLDAAGAVSCVAPPPPECGNGTLEQGEECEEDGDCPGGLCNPSCLCVERDVCGNGVVEQGEECERDADCGEGQMCGGCQCLEVVPTQGQCRRDADCEDEDPGDCVAYRCLVPPNGTVGECHAVLRYGGPCVPEPCKVGHCDLGGRCVSDGPMPCTEPPPSTCLAEDGLCDPGTGECVYPLAEGANCASDSDCASGLCEACHCTGEPAGGPPTVTLTVEPQEIVWGQDVQLSITYSDPEGTVGVYLLSFGDEVMGQTWTDTRLRGRIESGQTVVLTRPYYEPGSYVPTVVVTDGDGMTATADASLVVQENLPPTIEVSTISDEAPGPEDCVLTWTYHWNGSYGLSYEDPEGQNGTYHVEALLRVDGVDQVVDSASGTVASGSSVEIPLSADVSFDTCWDDGGPRERQIRIRFTASDPFGMAGSTMVSRLFQNPTACSCE